MLMMMMIMMMLVISGAFSSMLLSIEASSLLLFPRPKVMLYMMFPTCSIILTSCGRHSKIKELIPLLEMPENNFSIKISLSSLTCFQNVMHHTFSFLNRFIPLLTVFTLSHSKSRIPCLLHFSILTPSCPSSCCTLHHPFLACRLHL